MSRKQASIFRAKYGAAGIAIQLFTYLVAIGGFALAAFASARHSFVLGVIALGLVVGAPFLARLGRRLRTKIVQDLPAFLSLLESRKIPLILYLREFLSDSEGTSWNLERGEVSTWEESVLSDLRAYGAVLAVGIPGEVLASGGAYRLYLDETWKITVENLMDSARAILFRCGDTPGLTWELQQLARKGRLSRTILSTSSAKNGISAVYATLRSLGLPGTDLETRAAASLTQIRKVSEKRPDLVSSEQLKSLERATDALAGISSEGPSPLFSPFWMTTKDGIHSCESLGRAMALVGLKESRTGILDTENWWQAENVIAVLNIVTLLLFGGLVVLAFVPGMETVFGYVFVAALVLLFLVLNLRP